MAPSDPVLEKGLPSNLDAERSVLGAVLLDNSAYNYAAELLIADDFSSDGHRRIFARMVTLGESGRPIDPVTLTEELLRTNELETAGGVAYLSALTEGLPRATNVAHYARIVKDKAVLRRLVHTSNSILHEALEGSEDAADILGRAESAMLSVGEDRERDGLTTLGEVFKKTYRSLDDLLDRGSRITGLTTGFRRFDDLTCGLQPNDLILIAARPSMGKTAWALSVALHVAVKLFPPRTVGIFSLETSKEALLIRLLCAEARVDSHKFRSGFLNKEEMQRLAQAMGRLAQAPIYLDDTARPPPAGDARQGAAAEEGARFGPRRARLHPVDERAEGGKPQPGDFSVVAGTESAGEGPGGAAAGALAAFPGSRTSRPGAPPAAGRPARQRLTGAGRRPGGFPLSQRLLLEDGRPGGARRRRWAGGTDHRQAA